MASEYAIDMSQAHAGGDFTSNMIDIIIYFFDKVGIQLKVIDGQNATAGDLFELVLEEIDPAPNFHHAREAFSLWLVSDLIELQLKPTHIPFKLVCYWEELLEKYTSASIEDQQRDEPVIMFRRNVFYSLSTEKMVSDVEILRLLYYEAKKNILDGRYLLTQQECDSVAGLQAVITENYSNNAISQNFSATSEYFKSNIINYLPTHFTKRNRLIGVNYNPEKRILDKYYYWRDQRFTEASQLYKEYLSVCWKKPYYGSAFFRGQVEHPKKSMFTRPKDDPIFMAINTRGIYIIDMDDFVLLISLPFRQLAWQYVESAASQENPNCLPCLFLQFPDTCEISPGIKTTKLLQIFSREAILADNLIDACIELKKQSLMQDEIDGADNGQEVDHGIGAIANHFDRLALTTINNKGDVVKSNVRHTKNIK